MKEQTYKLEITNQELAYLLDAINLKKASGDKNYFGALLETKLYRQAQNDFILSVFTSIQKLGRTNQ
jgi:hypothetical protein